MGKRLPPGEAERRAAERKRATFAGENYKKYDPAKEGYGSYAQWAGAAAAFVNGDVIFEIESDSPQPKVNPQRKRPANLFLDMFDLEEMPADAKAFTAAYRKAVMKAFREHGSDTAPEYVNAFIALTNEYNRYKTRRGW